MAQFRTRVPPGRPARWATMTPAERAEQDRWVAAVQAELRALPADAVADVVREEMGGRPGVPVRLVRRKASR